MAKTQPTTSQPQSSGSKITANISKKAQALDSLDLEVQTPVQSVKIIERKLGGKVWGWAHFDQPLIEIDSRLRHKLQQEVLLHELLHIALPDLSEEAVTRTAEFMATHTWRFGLRRVQR